MEDLGLVSLFLLLGIGFAIYVGSPAICEYQKIEDCTEYSVPGFFALINMLATWKISEFINTFLFSPLTGIAAASAFGLAVYGFFSGVDTKTLLTMSIMITIATWLFVPFGFFKSIGGTELVAGTGFTLPMFITAIINLLLIFTIISFVLDRRL